MVIVALWLLTGFDQCEGLEDIRELEEGKVMKVISLPPTQQVS